MLGSLHYKNLLLFFCAFSTAVFFTSCGTIQPTDNTKEQLPQTTSILWDVPAYSQQGLRLADGSPTAFGCTPTSVAMIVDFWEQQNAPSNLKDAQVGAQGMLDVITSQSPLGSTDLISPNDSYIVDFLKRKGFEINYVVDSLESTKAKAQLIEKLSLGPQLAQVQYDWRREILSTTGVGHAIVITGINDDTVLYNDPWNGQKRTTTFGDYYSAWAPMHTALVNYHPVAPDLVRQKVVDEFNTLIFPIVCSNDLVHYAVVNNLGAPQTDELTQEKDENQQPLGATYMVQYFDKGIAVWDPKSGTSRHVLKPEDNPGGALGNASTITDPVAKASYIFHWPRMTTYLGDVVRDGKEFDSSTMTKVLALNREYPHYQVAQQLQLGFAQSNIFKFQTPDGIEFEAQIFQTVILISSHKDTVRPGDFEYISRPSEWLPTAPYCL